MLGRWDYSSGRNLIFADASFWVRCGAPWVRGLRKTIYRMNLYRRTPLQLVPCNKFNRRRSFGQNMVPGPPPVRTLLFSALLVYVFRMLRTRTLSCGFCSHYLSFMQSVIIVDVRRCFFYYYKIEPMAHTQKNLFNPPFLLTIFIPIRYDPP